MTLRELKMLVDDLLDQEPFAADLPVTMCDGESVKTVILFLDSVVITDRDGTEGDS